MENVNIRWEMPRKGFVKINVCGYFCDQPLENGNRSCIGVVIRSSRGSILRMYAGSLQIDDRRLNEFYAFLEGMKRAYYADDSYSSRTMLMLTGIDNDLASYLTEYGAAHWTTMVRIKKLFGRVHELWNHDMGLGPVLPLFKIVVQQLNQRRRDINFLKDVRLADAVDNDPASYLAEYGAAHWTTMVRIKKPFGRVHKLWNHDMGLGPVLPLFEIVGEDDLVPEVVEPEFDPPTVEAMIDEEEAMIKKL
ncbi:hypothetical protein POM88_027658 [Heracleum sosnowskyi]|uniref:Uncharacterized protein n=1 Tax=Heracleum sosnowskyi TaxID=360622 RepID=A0AAD8MQC4_9APIA|nr:hypothetical protein POM88_027658 [Heracleum sosnowskyi]